MGTVTNSVGTASRDYSTLAAWAAALPGNLVTDGNSYVAQCYNDSEFAVAGQVLSLSGHTTDATHTITVTTGPGQSFADNANAQTNALYYNQANGVGIRTTSGYVNMVLSSDNYCTFSKLQLNGTANGCRSLLNTGTNCVTDRCITAAAGTSGGSEALYLGATGLVTNCLLVSTTDGRISAQNAGGTLTIANCTFAKPAGGSASSTSYAYGTVHYENCGLFGSSALTGGSSIPTYVTSAVDSAVLVPPLGCTSAAYNTGTFQNITGGSFDFRLVSGSPLIDAGTTDTTDIPAAIDIVGTSRPQGSAWDIGAWEFASGGGVTPTFRRTLSSLGTRVGSRQLQDA